MKDRVSSQRDDLGDERPDEVVHVQRLKLHGGGEDADATPVRVDLEDRAPPEALHVAPRRAVIVEVPIQVEYLRAGAEALSGRVEDVFSSAPFVEAVASGQRMRDSV